MDSQARSEDQHVPSPEGILTEKPTMNFQMLPVGLCISLVTFLISGVVHAQFLHVPEGEHYVGEKIHIRVEGDTKFSIRYKESAIEFSPEYKFLYGSPYYSLGWEGPYAVLTPRDPGIYTFSWGREESQVTILEGERSAPQSEGIEMGKENGTGAKQKIPSSFSQQYAVTPPPNNQTDSPSSLQQAANVPDEGGADPDEDFAITVIVVGGLSVMFIIVTTLVRRKHTESVV